MSNTSIGQVGFETLAGRKLAQADLGDVLVIGLGVSGKALVEYLAPLIGSRVKTLTVLGGSANPETTCWSESIQAQFATASQEGALKIAFDTEDVGAYAPEDGFDVCLASPGISAFSDFYLKAKEQSSRMIGELEFAWEESPEDSVWVVITGTNGKTTTTKLTEHLLQSAGHRSMAVGNIGLPAIEAVGLELASRLGATDASDCEETAPSKRPFYVAEASSYQLASSQFISPEVAVILGITPDHIKWHLTHEHYKTSKLKALENLPQASGGVAVLDATNDEVREKVRELRGKSLSERGFEYIPIGTAKGIGCDMRRACGADNSAFVDSESDDQLTVAFDGREHLGGPASSLSIKGEHNRLNALAAMAAAVALGVGDDVLAEALPAFKALEHRIEPAGTVNGVSYVNDSKATNVDATLKAVAAFDPQRPIVLLGGRDKGTDLEELVDCCSQYAKAVVCFGEARERFASAFEGSDVDVHEAPGFDSAFELASSIASDGDVVLLSPACASFDEFSCFEERGDRFKELVGALQGNDPASSARG